VFSISQYVSFSELGSDPSSVLAIFMFVLASFLASFYLRSPRHIFTWLLGFFASAVIVFLFQVFRTGLSITLLPWMNFPFKTSNLFGSWIEFGIYFSLVGFIALFLFEVIRPKKLRIFFLVTAIMALVATLAVNVQVIWWTLFVFLLVLLAYLFSMKLTAKTIFRPTFVIILFVLFFIQAPVIVSTVTSYLGTETLEVRPSFAASWMVTQSALKENVVLGSGPATFLYDWIRFKPIEVNQGPFWNVRFASGAGFWPSMLATTGLAGAAAILFLIITLFFYGFKALVRSDKPRQDSFLVLVFIVSAMLLAYSLFYSPGFVLMLFFFLFVGMFLGMLSEYSLVEEYKIKLFTNSGASFVSALFIIFLLIVGFSGIYIISQKYIAAYSFGKGVSLFNLTGDVAGAETAVARALRFDERDEYYRGMVDIRLSQITRLLGEQDLAPDILRTRFQDLLSSAIQSAQAAIRINPVEPTNWFTLGRVYESVIPFQISGVPDFAVSSYQEAHLRNPTSPEPAFAQARIMVSLGDGAKAKALLEDALKLKGNYTPAHLLLAQLEEREGNITKAIERIQTAVILSPDNAGVLFQLGLLYYRVEQLENSRQVFERAVQINSNYSNARYFLGLIYDRLGNKEAALEQFERIFVFNPGNAEVERIIENLKVGRAALADISPPAPEPEEREEAPVED